MSETESLDKRRRHSRGPRWARRRRTMLWLAALLCLALALLGIRPVFRWFKSGRSAQLAAMGDALVSAGKWNEAADKYRAALHLDPVGYPALVGAARLASHLNRPEAVDLWEQVAKLPEATVSDRQQYADQLLRAGRSRIAAGIIENLLRTAPDTTTLGLASRYSQSTGEKDKALEFARLAAKQSPNDSLAQFNLAERLAEAARNEYHTEARTILWRLADQPGPYREPAVEALARAPEISNEERSRLLQLIGTFTPVKIKDALIAADLRLQLHPDQATQIYDQVTADWNKSEAAALVELARWLNAHQQAERVLSLFSSEAGLKNNQLLFARLDALGILQRWDEIEAVLARPDLTLDPSVLECFRARTSQGKNEQLDADLHWSHAISLASSDPLKLRFVANFAEQSHAPGVALKAYDQLSRFPDHAAFAYFGIERLSGNRGDLAVQRTAAAKISTLSPEDPNAAAQLAYLNLLAGTDVERNTATAAKLVQKFPDRLSFRVTAALGFLRQHDPGTALAQFKGPERAPPIDWSKAPPAWRAVYAAALRENEQTDAARELIKTIPIAQLSPEERALIEGK